MSTNALLSLSNVCKGYYAGEEELLVLKNVNLEVGKGEFLSVLGPSGSGKTTLMNILGFLDVPSSGTYLLEGISMDALTESEMANIRNKKIGFVFQNFQLLSRLTALANVELPLIYGKVGPRQRREKAMDVLQQVGIGEKAFSYPNQLSGGQQQRVAIARAMVTDPAIILADEPTGALDQKTGEQVMGLFMELNSRGRTIIMITHNNEVARIAERRVHILDGNIVEGGRSGARRNYAHVRRQHNKQ